MKKYSQNDILSQCAESAQAGLVVSSPARVIPPDLLPFFIVKRAGIDHSERAGVDYFRDFNNSKGLHEALMPYLGGKVFYTEEPSGDLTTIVEIKTGSSIENNIILSQYLGDFEKLEPLCIQDIGLRSDVKEIIRNLKRPQGAPYLLSLAGKFDGPRDLSENKRKYLAKNVSSKPPKQTR